MVRKENWAQLLSDYLKKKKAEPFAWHKNDCLSMAAGCVDLLTGSEFFKKYSDYHDEFTATEMLMNNGGVVGIIKACLGPGHQNIMMAKRGDVVIVKTPEITAGIIDDTGQRIAVVSRVNGLIRLPLTKAWRVWSY